MNSDFLLAGLIAGAAFLSLPAHADDNYVGLAVSKTNNFSPLFSGSSRTWIGDSKPSGYMISGGHEFGSGLAVEAGYADWGKASRDFSIAGTAGRQSTDASSAYLAARQEFFMNESLSLSAKLGLARNRYSSDDSLGQTSAAGAKTSLMGGLGLTYHISKNVAVTLQFEDFGKTGAGEHIHALSLGARFNFR